VLVAATALVAAVGTLVLHANPGLAATTFTVVPATGPGGITAPAQVVVLNGAGFKNTAGASQLSTASAAALGITANGNAAIQFQAGTSCSTTFSATANINVPLLNVSIPSATKLVITVPSFQAGPVAFLPLTTTTLAPKIYMLCAYSKNSTALLGGAKYTAYGVPTVTAVSQASAPTYGGVDIEVDGTGFTSASKAYVGGTAMTGVKVASDGLSLTGTVPAHAATSGATLTVTVTTEGGTGSLATAFGYVSAISISPQTGPAAGGTTIDIIGTGFNSLNFTGNAAVVFTVGAYTAAVGGGNLGVCTNIRVVLDTELVCDAPALTSQAYTVVVVADNTDAVLANSLPTGVTSGATFTSAPF